MDSGSSKFFGQFRNLPPLTKLFGGLGLAFAIILAIGFLSAEEPPKDPGVASANVVAAASKSAEEAKRQQALEEQREAAAIAKKRAAAMARADRRQKVRQAKRKRARAAKVRRQRARARTLRAERRRERAEQRALEAEQEQASNCHSSYEGACLDPNSSDYDCSGGSGDGPDYTGTVQVVGPDEYDLDRDGDGVGCDS